MIEYVVIYELVHLIEPHHTNAFWDRVERIVSDWSDRKQCENRAMIQAIDKEQRILDQIKSLTPQQQQSETKYHPTSGEYIENLYSNKLES